ncbi:MAG: PAS domain-containing protein [Myxococcales bacterium]|nr:PAS domain-containing protein [Myxococcales bacterium]
MAGAEGELGIGLAAMDSRGVIVHANRRLSELLRFPSQDLVGVHHREIIAAPSPRVLDELERLAAAGHGSTDRMSVRRRGGGTIDLWVQGAPQLDASGALVGIVALVTPHVAAPALVRAAAQAPVLPPPTGCPLTAREWQVVCLLPVASSSRKIAAQLGISAHTVRGHVQSALTKLGVRSRVALVAEFGCRACDRGGAACPKRHGRRPR